MRENSHITLEGGQTVVDNRELLLSELLRNPMGLTTDELSKRIKLDSSTMLELLEDLREEGSIDYRGIGSLRIWFASKSLKKTLEPLVSKLMLERILCGDFEELRWQLTSEEPGAVQVLDVRYVFLRSTIAAGIIKKFVENAGYGDASKALYELGMELGKKHIEFWKDRFAIVDKEFLKLCPRKLALYLASSTLRGWGKAELMEYNPKKGRCVVRVYNHPILLPEIKKPIHFLDAGVFAEILSHTTDKRIEVEETRCTAAGDHFCEFRSRFKK